MSIPKLNVLPPYSGSNSSCESLTFQADPENIQGGVAVSIVDRPTVRTFPGSYSKRAHTFRTAVGNAPAARARLGSEAFVNFDKHSVVPSGLVAKLCFQHRPARVVNGFGHSRFRKFGRADIADRDKLIVADEFGRPLVKMVAARIGDLGVNCANATLVPSPLRNSQHGFVLAVMPKRRDRRSIAARCEALKSKVDADATIACRPVVGNLALEADVPATPRVLDETTSFEDAFDLARFPEVESSLQIGDLSVFNLCGAWNEWNPPKRSLGSKADTEARAWSAIIARGHELPAGRGYGIGMDSKFVGHADAEPYKIKRCWPSDICPSLIPTLGLSLSANTKVPHLIAGDRVASQMLAGRRIFDAKFVGDDHEAKPSINREGIKE